MVLPVHFAILDARLGIHLFGFDCMNLPLCFTGEIDVDLIRNEWATVAQSEEDRTAWLESAFRKLLSPTREERS